MANGNGNITAALRQNLVEADLRSLDVRWALPGFWTSRALGWHLPTEKAWDAGRPQMIGSHITRMMEEEEGILRLYADRGANVARGVETQGRFTGATRVRYQITGDPIEAATVTSIAEVPMGSDRTLPLLRLMEHGNAHEEFVMSLPDLAHYVQQDRIEIAVT